MKKLLLLLLCVPLLFSCGNDKEEKSSSIVSCSITENIWINETNQINNLMRNSTSFATDSAHYGFYLALRFLKNGNIEGYKCGKSFINKTSDIINDNGGVGVWGVRNSLISDTCCYLMGLYGVEVVPPDKDGNWGSLSAKWKKIDDNTVVIIYPERPPANPDIGGKPNSMKTDAEKIAAGVVDRDTLNLIDCNTIESSNGIRLIPGFDFDEISPYYNRSPKLSNR